MRGQRSALSRREALILLSLLNHPWLLHDHLEEVAALELAHPEAHRLRAGIIAAFGQYGEGYLRLSYANSVDNIEIALDNMARALAKR